MTKIALLGAGGKMGVRLATNLKDTRFDVDHVEVSEAGRARLLDAIGAETYATVFSFVESQHEKGLFWAGSDDGLIHISKDGGQSWQNVTPEGLADWTMISMIEQSPHDPATVYVAATRYKLDDYQPYLYKTSDYGQTWQKITNGIREDDFTRVLREDPAQRGLLYVGTETGIYISFDDGANWRRMGGNFPVVPVYDMQRKLDDLVVATHGRSFWILDDLGPLQQSGGEPELDALKIFQPKPAYKFTSATGAAT